MVDAKSLNRIYVLSSKSQNSASFFTRSLKFRSLNLGLFSIAFKPDDRYAVATKSKSEI
jgi:hypothetical protein